MTLPNYQKIERYLEKVYPEWKSARDISKGTDIMTSRVVGILKYMENVEASERNEKVRGKLYRKRKVV